MKKLKLRNLTILVSQEMQKKNLRCIWFGRIRFAVFQILTTKRKGMVVDNPSPRVPPGILRLSIVSPGSARLLMVTGAKSPEGLGLWHSSDLSELFWNLQKKNKQWKEQAPGKIQTRLWWSYFVIIQTSD